MNIEVSPLIIALAISALGMTLLTWHRRGGPRWMLAAGGFFFILSRIMMAGVCALAIVSIVCALGDGDTDRFLPGIVFAALFLAIGAWSVLAVVSAVVRDAFGAPTEEVGTKGVFS